MFIDVLAAAAFSFFGLLAFFLKLFQVGLVPLKENLWDN